MRSLCQGESFRTVAMALRGTPVPRVARPIVARPLATDTERDSSKRWITGLVRR